MPPPPQQVTQVPIGGKQTPVVGMQPGEGMVIPRQALKRVFIGIGWRAPKTGAKVDVDCSANGFSKGVRSEGNTVWYSHLSNAGAGKRGAKATIVHSGDILTGQQGGPLEDLERIYVDLEGLDKSLDCIAFEANVFTGGLTFANLEEAYIRLVNVDTNQELSRFTLSFGPGSGLNSRVLLFARLFQYPDRFILSMAGQPAPETLQKSKKNQPMMIAPSLAPQPAPAPGKPAPQQAPPPSKSYALPALAVATVAGTAAAVAIFSTGALSMDNMNPGLFESGVDFGNLLDIGGDGLEALGDVLSAAGGGIADLAGTVGGGIADAAGSVADAAPDIGGAVVDGLGTAGEAIGDVGSQAVEGVGDLCSQIPCGEVCGALEGCVGEIGGCLEGCISNCNPEDLVNCIKGIFG